MPKDHWRNARKQAKPPIADRTRFARLRHAIRKRMIAQGMSRAEADKQSKALAEQRFDRDRERHGFPLGGHKPTKQPLRISRKRLGGKHEAAPLETAFGTSEPHSQSTPKRNEAVSDGQ